MENERIILNCSLVEDFRGIEDTVQKQRDEIRVMLEQVINRHKGYSPVSLQEGQVIAQFINETAAQYGLRLAFPDTQETATLAFRLFSGAKEGAFILRKNSKDSLYIGRALPELHLIPMKPHGLRPLAKRTK